jgi:EAL domain-containing protein (putative c-di-GMP-specific phosphodiesterase class I)
LGTSSLDRRQLVELESDLHKAVENDELRVYFQAQTDLHTAQPVGVEALVRWQHPQFGLLPPGAFLPMAEESGLIVAIDRWVRRTAFAQGRAWLDAGAPMRIAVNLSTRELTSPALVPQLASELAESGLPAGLVEVEITDRIVMNDADLPEILADLRSLGVRLAIDDFGTGNSVLGRLQRCRVDTLKIDRSFVQDIAPGADAPVVQALVSLAHSLGLDVVAEGVETEEQAAVLRDYGCGIAQGFLYSRPVPADQMTAVLTEGAASRVCPALGL